MPWGTTTACGDAAASTGMLHILHVICTDNVTRGRENSSLQTEHGFMGGREDPLVDEEAERMAKRMRSLVSTSYLYSPYSV